MKTYSKTSHRKAFTLVELLASMVILTVLMLLMVTSISKVQETFVSAKSRTEEFSEARAAFEALARRLSQATLDAYWDYNTAGSKYYYERQSDLHFVSGQSSDLLNSVSTIKPLTHSVFFQAPFGYAGTAAGNTSSVVGGTGSDPGATQLERMSELMNAWGYYVDYGSDLDRRPQFLSNGDSLMLYPERKRFRLMELRIPSEKLLIYSDTLNLKAQSSTANAYKWFRGPFADNKNIKDYSVPIAENILALVIAPRGSMGVTYDKWRQQGGTSVSKRVETLAEDFNYDSRASRLRPAWSTDRKKKTTHQVPPVMQITLVAVDERTYQQFENRMGSPAAAESFVRDLMNNKFTVNSDAKLEEDFKEVEDALYKERIQHKIFSTAVSIRSAKWVTEYEYAP